MMKLGYIITFIIYGERLEVAVWLVTIYEQLKVTNQAIY